MPEEMPPQSSDHSSTKRKTARTRMDVRFKGETAWLSLNQMAELFQRDKSVISKHIKNTFAEGELRAEATVAKFATVQTEGGRTVSRDIEFYNLDVIISVGYRVKSHRGTQFRHLGDATVAGIHRQGLHDGRRAAQESAGQGPDGLLRRAAGTHSGYPGE